MEQLKALGRLAQAEWRGYFGIQRPWIRAVGKSAEGDDLRFTRKGDDLFVTVLGRPKAQSITIENLPAKTWLNNPPGTGRGHRELSAKVQLEKMRIV